MCISKTKKEDIAGGLATYPWNSIFQGAEGSLYGDKLLSA